MSDAAATCRLAITVHGIVQGVGFRPFVYQLATARQLAGWVVNEADAVRIEVQGARDAIQSFVHALRTEAPPAARIERLQVDEIPHVAAASGPFAIRTSPTGSVRRPTIPADLAVCAECRREVMEPAERRYRYPFTNCTNCGPRWSIITGLPYDRPRTSMDEFIMCAACRREYEHPADRRFHAQPIACPECGPQLELLRGDGEKLGRGDAALEAAAQAVRTGHILALKGIGGFQLVVDATDDAAVGRLRARKHRPDKPFALLVSDIDAARRICHVSELERRALESAEAPILLLARRSDVADAPPIADAVAPGNPYLGVVLPYTPLHQLLIARVGRPVVCTSGNRAEEPMAVETHDALTRLGDIADLVLTHNRRIVRPVDDSVAREDGGELQLLRRARGYAPVPIALGRTLPCVLAVGGHLKNVVALSIGQDVILSPHVGDLDNTLSMDVHRRTIADLVDFFQVTPEVIACDMHPDYSSTRTAQQLAARWQVPLVRVQHHHAHVLSAVAEWQLTGRTLGLAWDGTGYGLDGTAWGSEAIVVEGGAWHRVAHVRAFPLPGGDRAAREPRRSALGLLHEMGIRGADSLAARWFAAPEFAALQAALDRRHLFPRTTGMGRLFDAVAALGGLKTVVSFEGEAAMQLEFAADPAAATAYPLPLSDTVPAVADWEPLVRGVLEDLRRGSSLAAVAGRFHRALAELAVAMATRAACPQVVLTGGCFQNRLLTRCVRARLSEAGFDVYTQHRIPPGDGGIALGQVFGAAMQVGA